MNYLQVVDDALANPQLTRNHKKGLLMEVACHVALSILAIPHNHNPFDQRYAIEAGAGVDFEISTNRGKILIETKNISQRYLCSPSWISREVLKRPKNYSNIIEKIIIFSHANISHNTRGLLKTEGWNTIMLGFQVTKENIKKAINSLIKKLYWLKSSQYNRSIQVFPN